METTHYLIKNLDQFSYDLDAVEKLKNYLNYIEVVFPTIEEVFGQAWSDKQINIELNDSTKNAAYERIGDSHVVKMGIYNKNIQKKYPENLWGCLFHETHHAFFNPIINDKIDRKIFNGGCEGEPFNFAFMATTYLKLREKNIINAQFYEYFLNKLERELPSGAKNLFKEYVNMFSTNIENFSKFISYLKSSLKLSNSIFINRSNFRQDLNKAKEFLAN